jgi:hypothetical protein
MQCSCETTDDSASTIAQKSYVPQAMQDAVATADVILVPYEGWGKHKGPVFAKGTSEFAELLRDQLPSDLQLAVPVNEDDYEEIALHGELLVIGTIAVTSLVLPILAKIVAHFIIKKIEASLRPGTTDMRITLLVLEEKRCVKFSYEGKPKEFLEALRDAKEADEIVAAMSRLALKSGRGK